MDAYSHSSIILPGQAVHLIRQLDEPALGTALCRRAARATRRERPAAGQIQDTILFTAGFASSSTSEFPVPSCCPIYHPKQISRSRFADSSGFTPDLSSFANALHRKKPEGSRETGPTETGDMPLACPPELHFP